MSDFDDYARDGLGKAKWTFTTRRVDKADVFGFTRSFATARPGDLVLARVSSIGHHAKLQLSVGRAATSYIGDWAVLSCGNRYAPDQFEGVAEINSDGCDLLAGGGLIGRMRVSHQRIIDSTKLTPIALLTGRDGKPLNVAQYALPSAQARKALPVFLVVGSSMNAGKTTAAASLAHGFTRAGIQVAAIKLTGTGAFGDFNMFQDAGVQQVLDFTDAGMASTYMEPIPRLEQAFQSLTAHAIDNGAELAVIELADGLYQQETAALLKSTYLRNQAVGLMFATADAISAVGATRHLTEQGLVPKAISGKISCSPLSVAEVESNVAIPVLSREMLCNPGVAVELLPAEFKTASPFNSHQFAA